MSKILAVIRSSSERQETESQKKEMIQFCIEKGYAEDDIKVIEVAGASARKLNKKYLDMLESIKATIINEGFTCCAFWHLNRLGRNESKLVEMKDFFKKNKIQVYIKYPSIQLFHNDGTLDEGGNLFWSMMAVCIEKDTDEMFAKMKRGKKRNAEQGKYNGSTLLLGFKLNENNYYEVDEDGASVVRLIFELYSTGEYSTATLAAEMQQRGFKFKKHHIQNILENTAYIGYTDYSDSRRSHRKYPRIISDELFNQCKDIRTSNNSAQDKTKQYYLATKLLQCHCGYNYIMQMFGTKQRIGGIYTCLGHRDKKCDNKLSINQMNLDRLLWFIARDIHIKYLMSLDSSKIEEYEAQLHLLIQKIEVAEENKLKLQDKIEKIADNYVEGLINKEKKNKQLEKVKFEESEYNAQIKAYKAEIEKVTTLIKSIQHKDHPLFKLLDAKDSIELTKKELYDIVHMHIKKIYIEPNGKTIDIHIQLMDGKELKFNYRHTAKKKTKQGWFDRFYHFDKSITEKVYKNSYEFDICFGE